MIGLPQRSQNENSESQLRQQRGVELLDFLFAVVAFPNEHRPRVCDDNSWMVDGFQFLDPNPMIRN